jgi:hypothetical protein
LAYEDRFLAICGSLEVLWTKNRGKYGAHSRICRPANQRPTGSWAAQRKPPKVQPPAGCGVSRLRFDGKKFNNSTCAYCQQPDHALPTQLTRFGARLDRNRQASCHLTEGGLSDTQSTSWLVVRKGLAWRPVSAVVLVDRSGVGGVMSSGDRIVLRAREVLVSYVHNDDCIGCFRSKETLICLPLLVYYANTSLAA